jgi:hypothetical protein
MSHQHTAPPKANTALRNFVKQYECAQWRVTVARTCERPAAAVASKAVRASASAESAAPVSTIACATLALAAAIRAVRLAYVGTDEVICLLAFLVVAALQHMAHSANQQ